MTCFYARLIRCAMKVVQISLNWSEKPIICLPRPSWEETETRRSLYFWPFVWWWTVVFLRCAMGQTLPSGGRVLHQDFEILGNSFLTSCWLLPLANTCRPDVSITSGLMICFVGLLFFYLRLKPAAAASPCNSQPHPAGHPPRLLCYPEAAAERIVKYFC